ncbi:MAG TPA: DNA/RNA non-specific endonuclease [Pyrinomonadaceae bacterium]|nr:DNA/RNA non-specific endonuclease [Pyrinomonadaceae bacterium]
MYDIVNRCSPATTSVTRETANHQRGKGNRMKKSKFGIAAKTLLVFSAGLIVLTISLTTATMTPLGEGFEAGGKTSYAAGNVALGTGSWFMDDALTGNLSTDRKTGSFSARIRNTGLVHMNFNKTGAGTVSIQHAIFGSDGSSTWQLWSSTNSGSTWTQVGSTVTTSSTSLQTASFTVNNANAIRFEIRKVSGGANRINVDNVQIGDFSSPTPTPTPTPPLSEHLTMGNPSNAVTSISQPNNYLMEKPQYAMSYSRDNGESNWVSWHLDSSWLGSTPRQDDFRADTTLPTGWYRVQATDYSGSGFDRGHMCPSGDRTITVAANSATFLMTNMIPQLPANNQGVWANLESYSRTLVSQGNELYIISGGQGLQYFIANGHVAVPAQTWKVIIVLPVGSNDVSRVTTSTRTIAVVIPNSGSIGSDWRTYRVSVDQVEAITGFDFFSNVPASIQNVIEAQVDNQ